VRRRPRPTGALTSGPVHRITGPAAKAAAPRTRGPAHQRPQVRPAGRWNLHQAARESIYTAGFGHSFLERGADFAGTRPLGLVILYLSTLLRGLGILLGGRGRLLAPRLLATSRWSLLQHGTRNFTMSLSAIAGPSGGWIRPSTGGTRSSFYLLTRPRDEFWRGRARHFRPAVSRGRSSGTAGQADRSWVSEHGWSFLAAVASCTISRQADVKGLRLHAFGLTPVIDVLVVSCSQSRW